MTKRRRKFLRLERVTLFESKARVKAENLLPSRRRQKSILQVVSVYNVGLRKLFGHSAPKRSILGAPSAFALANLFKLALSLHTALRLKNLLEALNPLLCG